MNIHDLETRALSWLAAWNRHDVDAILGHYSDYAVHTSPLPARRTGPTSRTLCGRAALREAIANVLACAPDLRLRARHVLRGLTSVVLVYECGDVLAAEAMEFNERGQITRASGHWGPRPGPRTGYHEPPPTAEAISGQIGTAALGPVR